jgi:hypothetical protein
LSKNKNTYSNFGGSDDDKVDDEAELPSSSCATLVSLTPVSDEYGINVDFDEIFSE